MADRDDLKDALACLYEHLEAHGEASTAKLAGRYRGMVPGRIMDRSTFEHRVAPVLADADGVAFRCYRIDPDGPTLSAEAIKEHAAEAFPLHRETVERGLLGAMYRVPRDGPPGGYTRLGLAVKAGQRANAQVPESFVGPEDPEDIEPEVLRRKADGLRALLDMPGVEPPADPAWRFARGAADE